MEDTEDMETTMDLEDTQEEVITAEVSNLDLAEVLTDKKYSRFTHLFHIIYLNKRLKN